MRSTQSLKTPSMPMRSSVLQHPLVLGVPPEGVAPEPVEQRRQAARPVGVVEVDGVDAGARPAPPPAAPAPSLMPARAGWSRPAGRRGRRGRRRRRLASRGSTATAAPAGPVPPPAPPPIMAGAGGGVLHVEGEVVVGPAGVEQLGQGRDVGGELVTGAGCRSARDRSRARTTPSWSSTGTPSLVSHTSLSRPVAPRRRASVKASIVFSGAWARAPRWAKAMGGSRSDGSRCCTDGTVAARGLWWAGRLCRLPSRLAPPT